MMMKKKPVNGQATYVPVDPNTGEELPQRQKRRQPRKARAKPEEILPKTPLQIKVIELYKDFGRTGFATDAELGAFRALEKKFNPTSQSLEAAVWTEWILKMIAWAEGRNAREGKPIIDVFKLCSAIGNKQSWADFWHNNRARVERQLKNAVSGKDLESAYRNKESTW